MPVVTVPDAPPPRLDYWLTRKQVADRIRVARKGSDAATYCPNTADRRLNEARPGAILNLRWVPSADGGWFDLETRTLHRNGVGRVGSKKRQPRAFIHARLLPHPLAPDGHGAGHKPRLPLPQSSCR